MQKHKNKCNTKMKKRIVFSLFIIIFLIAFYEDGLKKEGRKPSEFINTAEARNDLILQTGTDAIEYNDTLYKIIKVDGGDLSGERLSNAAVDVGYGNRTYWALTNAYGQLIHVLADKVILQDEEMEPVTRDGRYYSDEAKVPGTQREDLDEGHIVADSLGGVSNAYNITPQDSTLNRHGNQAYMEKQIRDAGGCDKFVATITYPDTHTQIPSKYKYEYILKGTQIVEEFENKNPDAWDQ